MKPDWSNINLKQSKNQHKKNKDYVPKKRKRSNYRNEEGRLVNTKAYAIAWGVINKPYSTTDLYNKCKAPDAPSYYFITRKCWKGYPFYYKDLVKAGMQPRPPRSDMERRKILGKVYAQGFKTGLLDKDYDIARMAAQYGVTTKQSYIDIRKINPQSKVFLPSMITLIKIFGTWKRFSYEVMKYNTDATINEYVTKSAQCGHWLRLSECDKLKIPIRGIMDILKPSIFNSLCYKKLSLLGLSSNIDQQKESKE